MTVSIDVEVARVQRALVIPSEAVRDLFSSSPWVIAVRGGRAEKRPLRLGVRGEGLLEVQSGLEEGESVLLAAARWVKLGQRVRPRRVEAESDL
jgi:HlyD family secretion protein